MDLTRTSTKPPSRQPSKKWAAATMAGAAVSAFLASACCIGPLLLAAAGLGGAGLFVKLDRYRPWFGAVTALALAAGFWSTYRTPRKIEADGCGCEHPKPNRMGRIALWAVTALAIGLWIFPYLAERLIG